MSYNRAWGLSINVSASKLRDLDAGANKLRSAAAALSDVSLRISRVTQVAGGRVTQVADILTNRVDQLKDLLTSIEAMESRLQGKQSTNQQAGLTGPAGFAGVQLREKPGKTNKGIYSDAEYGRHFGLSSPQVNRIRQTTGRFAPDKEGRIQPMASLAITLRSHSTLPIVETIRRSAESQTKAIVGALSGLKVNVTGFSGGTSAGTPAASPATGYDPRIAIESVLRGPDRLFKFGTRRAAESTDDDADTYDKRLQTDVKTHHSQIAPGIDERVFNQIDIADRAVDQIIDIAKKRAIKGDKFEGKSKSELAAVIHENVGQVGREQLQGQLAGLYRQAAPLMGNRNSRWVEAADKLDDQAIAGQTIDPRMAILRIRKLQTYIRKMVQAIPDADQLEAADPIVNKLYHGKTLSTAERDMARADVTVRQHAMQAAMAGEIDASNPESVRGWYQNYNKNHPAITRGLGVLGDDVAGRLTSDIEQLNQQLANPAKLDPAVRDRAYSQVSAAREAPAQLVKQTAEIINLLTHIRDAVAPNAGRAAGGAMTTRGLPVGQRAMTTRGMPTRAYPDPTSDPAERKAGLPEYREAMGGYMSRSMAWGTSAALVYGGARAARSAISQMSEYEQAIVSVQKVLNPLGADINTIGEAAERMAQDFGVGLTETVGGMEIFAQQGREMADIIGQTRTSLLATNVTTLSLKEATEGLTAAQKQFQLTTNSSMRILDAWNEVENTTAVTTDVLVSALKNAGVAAREAGIEFDMFNGIVAAIGEATRKSGEAIGTGLKFMFQRIRGDQAVEAFQSIGIATRNAEGDFKNAGDVLTELAGRWNSLSDAQQHHMAVSIAGTRRLNDFLIMMETWDRAVEISVTSLLSQGSAMRENEVVMQTLHKRTEQLRASYHSLLVSMADSGALDVLKQSVDLLKQMADLVGGINKASQGLLGGVIGSLGLAGGAIGTMGFMGMHVLPGAMNHAVTDRFGVYQMAEKQRKQRSDTRTSQAAAAVSANAMGTMGLPGGVGGKLASRYPREMGWVGRHRMNIAGAGLMTASAMVAAHLPQRDPEGPMRVRDLAGKLGTEAGTSAGFLAMMSRDGFPLTRKGFGSMGKMGQIAVVATVLGFSLGAIKSIRDMFGESGDQKRLERDLNALRAVEDRIRSTESELQKYIQDLSLGRESGDVSMLNQIKDAILAFAPEAAPVDPKTGRITGEDYAGWKPGLEEAVLAVRRQRGDILTARADAMMQDPAIEKAVTKIVELQQQMLTTPAEDYATRAKLLAEMSESRGIVDQKVLQALTAIAQMRGSSGQGLGIDAERMADAASKLDTSMRTLTEQALQNYVYARTNRRVAAGEMMDAAGVGRSDDEVAKFLQEALVQHRSGGPLYSLQTDQMVTSDPDQIAQIEAAGQQTILRTAEGVEARFAGTPAKLADLVRQYADTVSQMVEQTDYLIQGVENISQAVDKSLGFTSPVERMASGRGLLAEQSRAAEMVRIEREGIRRITPSSITSDDTPQTRYEATLGHILQQMDRGQPVSLAALTSAYRVQADELGTGSTESMRNLFNQSVGAIDRGEYGDTAAFTDLMANLPDEMASEFKTQMLGLAELSGESRQRQEELIFSRLVHAIGINQAEVRRQGESQILTRFSSLAEQSDRLVENLRGEYTFLNRTGGASDPGAYLDSNGRLATEQIKDISTILGDEVSKQRSLVAAAEEPGDRAREERLLQQMVALLQQVDANIANPPGRVGSDVERERLRVRIDREGTLADAGAAIRGQTGLNATIATRDALRGLLATFDKNVPEQVEAMDRLAASIDQLDQGIKTEQMLRQQAIAQPLQSPILTEMLTRRMTGQQGQAANGFVDAQISEVTEVIQRLVRELEPQLQGAGVDQLGAISQALGEFLRPALAPLERLREAMNPGQRMDELLAGPAARAIAEQVRDALDRGVTAEQILGDPNMRQAARQDPMIRRLLEQNLAQDVYRQAIELQVQASDKNTGAMHILASQIGNLQKALASQNLFLNPEQISRAFSVNSTAAPEMASGSMALAGSAAVDSRGRIRKDETPAMLHRGEIVLTADQSDALLQNRYAGGTLPRGMGPGRNKDLAQEVINRILSGLDLNTSSPEGVSGDVLQSIWRSALDRSTYDLSAGWGVRRAEIQSLADINRAQIAPLDPAYAGMWTQPEFAGSMMAAPGSIKVSAGSGEGGWPARYSRVLNHELGHATLSSIESRHASLSPNQTSVRGRLWNQLGEAVLTGDEPITQAAIRRNLAYPANPNGGFATLGDQLKSNPVDIYSGTGKNFIHESVATMFESVAAHAAGELGLDPGLRLASPHLQDAVSNLVQGSVARHHEAFTLSSSLEAEYGHAYRNHLMGATNALEEAGFRGTANLDEMVPRWTAHVGPEDMAHPGGGLGTRGLPSGSSRTKSVFSPQKMRDLASVLDEDRRGAMAGRRLTAQELSEAVDAARPQSINDISRGMGMDAYKVESLLYSADLRFDRRGTSPSNWHPPSTEGSRVSGRSQIRLNRGVGATEDIVQAVSNTIDYAMGRQFLAALYTSPEMLEAGNEGVRSRIWRQLAEAFLGGDDEFTSAVRVSHFSAPIRSGPNKGKIAGDLLAANPSLIRGPIGQSMVSDAVSATVRLSAANASGATLLASEVPKPLRDALEALADASIATNDLASQTDPRQIATSTRVIQERLDQASAHLKKAGYSGDANLEGLVTEGVRRQPTLRGMVDAAESVESQVQPAAAATRAPSPARIRKPRGTRQVAEATSPPAGRNTAPPVMPPTPLRSAFDENLFADIVGDYDAIRHGGTPLPGNTQAAAAWTDAKRQVITRGSQAWGIPEGELEEMLTRARTTFDSKGGRGAGEWQPFRTNKPGGRIDSSSITVRAGSGVGELADQLRNTLGHEVGHEFLAALSLEQNLDLRPGGQGANRLFNQVGELLMANDDALTTAAKGQAYAYAIPSPADQVGKLRRWGQNPRRSYRDLFRSRPQEITSVRGAEWISEAVAYLTGESISDRMPEMPQQLRDALKPLRRTVKASHDLVDVKGNRGSRAYHVAQAELNAAVAEATEALERMGYSGNADLGMRVGEDLEGVSQRMLELRRQQRDSHRAARGDSPVSRAAADAAGAVLQPTLADQFPTFRRMGQQARRWWGEMDERYPARPKQPKSPKSPRTSLGERLSDSRQARRPRQAGRPPIRKRVGEWIDRYGRNQMDPPRAWRAIDQTRPGLGQRLAGLPRRAGDGLGRAGQWLADLPTRAADAARGGLLRAQDLFGRGNLDDRLIRWAGDEGVSLADTLAGGSIHPGNRAIRQGARNLVELPDRAAQRAMGAIDTIGETGRRWLSPLSDESLAARGHRVVTWAQAAADEAAWRVKDLFGRGDIFERAARWLPEGESVGLADALGGGSIRPFNRAIRQAPGRAVAATGRAALSSKRLRGAVGATGRGLGNTAEFLWRHRAGLDKVGSVLQVAEGITRVGWGESLPDWYHEKVAPVFNRWDAAEIGLALSRTGRAGSLGDQAMGIGRFGKNVVKAGGRFLEHVPGVGHIARPVNQLTSRTGGAIGRAGGKLGAKLASVPGVGRAGTAIGTGMRGLGTATLFAEAWHAGGHIGQGAWWAAGKSGLVSDRFASEASIQAGNIANTANVLYEAPIALVSGAWNAAQGRGFTSEGIETAKGWSRGMTEFQQHISEHGSWWDKSAGRLGLTLQMMLANRDQLTGLDPLRDGGMMQTDQDLFMALRTPLWQMGDATPLVAWIAQQGPVPEGVDGGGSLDQILRQRQQEAAASAREIEDLKASLTEQLQSTYGEGRQGGMQEWPQEHRDRLLQMEKMIADRRLAADQWAEQINRFNEHGQNSGMLFAETIEQLAPRLMNELQRGGAEESLDLLVNQFGLTDSEPLRNSWIAAADALPVWATPIDLIEAASGQDVDANRLRQLWRQIQTAPTETAQNAAKTQLHALFGGMDASVLNAAAMPGGGHLPSGAEADIGSAKSEIEAIRAYEAMTQPEAIRQRLGGLDLATYDQQLQSHWRGIDLAVNGAHSVANGSPNPDDPMEVESPGRLDDLDAKILRARRLITNVPQLNAAWTAVEPKLNELPTAFAAMPDYARQSRLPEAGLDELIDHLTGYDIDSIESNLRGVNSATRDFPDAMGRYQTWLGGAEELASQLQMRDASRYQLEESLHAPELVVERRRGQWGTQLPGSDEFITGRAGVELRNEIQRRQRLVRVRQARSGGTVKFAQQLYASGASLDEDFYDRTMDSRLGGKKTFSQIVQSQEQLEALQGGDSSPEAMMQMARLETQLNELTLQSGMTPEALRQMVEIRGTANEEVLARREQIAAARQRHQEARDARLADRAAEAAGAAAETERVARSSELDRFLNQSGTIRRHGGGLVSDEFIARKGEIVVTEDFYQKLLGSVDALRQMADRQSVRFDPVETDARQFMAMSGEVRVDGRVAHEGQVQLTMGGDVQQVLNQLVELLSRQSGVKVRVGDKIPSEMIG